MKKIRIITALVAGVAFALAAIGCASNNVAATQETSSSKQKRQKTVEYETVDWDGAVAGKDVPEWPFNLQDDGLSALDDYPGIKEKVGSNHYFLTQSENTNKKLAREEARNAISFQIAQQLNTVAIATFDQVIDNREQAQETINAAASKARFTGFERVAETWVFRIKTDHSRNNKTTEEYTYYDLFVIDRDVFEAQANKYLSEIIGQVVKSENMQKANQLRDDALSEIHQNGIPQQEVEGSAED